MKSGHAVGVLYRRGWIFIGITLFFLLLPRPHAVTGQNRRLGRDTSNEKRIALVIGNGAYRHARTLPNPPNDAAAMARALKEVGFEVLGPGGQGYVELDQRGMLRAIKEFGEQLDGNTVGLFYFAGHGVQANETNYLIPTDADPSDETELKYQGVDVRDVLERFAGNRLNIVILDACRDNPFARGFRRSRSAAGDGLRQVEAPTGTLIAYATAPGKTASDGTGSNGLYTQELLSAMRVPGLTIEQVFKRVRIEVEAKSNGSQVPWENSSLKGEFFFVAGSTGGTTGGRDPVKPRDPVVTREKPRGTLVITTAQAGTEVLVDGVSRGRSEVNGERFRIEGLVAGQTVEVVGRLKGKTPLSRKVEVVADRELLVQIEFEQPPVFQNAFGMYFRLVPAGTFVMGSEPDDETRWNTFLKPFNQAISVADQRPSRRVTIGKPFYMGTFEVTQAQWQYVAARLPKVQRDLLTDPSPYKGSEIPVQGVSFEDAEEFVARLNRLGDGHEYAIPTEAQWEYTCRAGTISDYAGDLNELGWYGANSGRVVIDINRAWTDAGGDLNRFFDQTIKPNGNTPHPIGTKRPNPWGFYDMHGNAWEWCADFYAPSYSGMGTVDPTGPATGQFRVLRGGSWDFTPFVCRSANRIPYAPATRGYNVGLRVIARR